MPEQHASANRSNPGFPANRRISSETVIKVELSPATDLVSKGMAHPVIRLEPDSRLGERRTLWYARQVDALEGLQQFAGFLTI